jgi:outer membrane protein TolC
MKRSVYCSLSIACSLFAISGCSTLNTRLSISKKELPASFEDQKSAPSIANMQWRKYFADTQLQKLIDDALTSNIDLQLALQRIEISRSSVKLANAVLLPQVNLSVAGGVRKFGLYTMDGAGNATTDITPGQTVPVNLPDIFLGVQSSWEVDVWRKLRNRRASAILIEHRRDKLCHLESGCRGCEPI